MAKYLLVENRQIVHLGPIDWRPRFIQSELDDLEVAFTVPPNEQGYIKINDNFELLPVNGVNSPEIDTIFESPVGPTWSYNSDFVTAEYTKVDKPLEEIRTTIKSVAAAARYEKESKGTQVTISPEITGQVTRPQLNPETGEPEEVTETVVTSPAVVVTADTSRDGRAIFVQVYATLPDGASVDWKFPEGWMNITKEQLGLIIAGGFTYIQEQFAWEKNIGDRAAAASTMEELKTIYNELLPTPVNPLGV